MKKPKILLYDIETSPNLGYTWGKWEQNVIAYKEEWQLLSFSHKWLGESRIHVSSQRTLSEKKLVRSLHETLSEADIVVAHNGDDFDNKKANAKFLQFGLAPASPFLSIDTKKVAKRHFKFNSNSLNDLGEYLKVGQKVKTGGFDLWLGCMQGDDVSWATMERYNKQDVLLLENVYLKLRPFIKNHPNMSLDGCPQCGGTRFKSHGLRYAAGGAYRRSQCLACGAWSREKISLAGSKPTRAAL